MTYLCMGGILGRDKHSQQKLMYITYQIRMVKEHGLRPAYSPSGQPPVTIVRKYMAVARTKVHSEQRMGSLLHYANHKHPESSLTNGV